MVPVVLSIAAPKDSWIQIFPKAGREVVPVVGSKARTFIIVFGLGSAFAIACAFVVDGFKRGVKNTRRGETIVLESNMSSEVNDSAVQSVKEARPTRAKRTSTPKKTSKPANEHDTTTDSSITA